MIFSWFRVPGNDSNLLIALYREVVPDDLIMQFHRLWEWQWFPSQPCQMLSEIQIMPLNSLSITLTDNVKLILQPWFIQRPSICHPHYYLKGRQQIQKTLQGCYRPFPKDMSHNTPAYLVIGIEQPAMTWLRPNVAPLLIHFCADNHIAPWMYPRRYWTGPEFFKCRKMVFKPIPIMRALARHPTPFIAILMIFWCVPGWDAV